MDRLIKFYGWNDFATYLEVERIKEAIQEVLEKEIDEVNVVKVLEWVNIQKFIEGGSDFIGIKSSEIDTVNNFFQKQISIFFNKISESNFEEILKELPRTYLDDFLNTFSNYKLAKVLEERIIMEMFSDTVVSTYNLLKHKYFSENYPNFMKRRIFSSPKVIEILLTQILERSHVEFFTPKNISNEEWEDLILKYISMEDANLNYIRILQNSITVPKFHFQVTAEVKILAKRRCKEIEENFFDKDTDTSQNISIKIFSDREEYEENINSTVKPAYIGLVDKKEIIKNSSFEDLFDYLSLNLELFSVHNILRLPRYKNLELGITERILEANTPKTYKIGLTFNLKEHYTLAMLNIFRSILEKDLGISLEDIICWYFNNHIKSKFKTSFLPLDFLSKTESTANRNAKIFSIEENLRKQYFIIVNKGIVDKEVYNEAPLPKLSSLPSKVKNKYIYLNDTQENSWIQYQLFSDQSEIIHINSKITGKTFDELLLKNDLTLQNFQDYQKRIINKLIDMNIVNVEERGGVLKFKNIWEIIVLKKIYYNTVFSFYYANINEHAAINRLLNRGILRSESTLFSVPEVEYMNFIMNTGDWDDGYGLRNNYQHGGVYYDNNGQYGREYLLGMIILITYMIKIDEEFDLQNSTL
ncbi:hypothetical protein [Lactococcus lactis]|uniref:hypothetical protein n=1 Tax=Lactococcus lactis TaxID=1358 RepID=UPI00300E68E3